MWLGGLLVAGAVLCGGLALLLIRQASKNQTRAGLPLTRAEVVYSDSGAWEKTPYNLKSENYGLVGKPDYILRGPDSIIPVEVKPLRKARQPYLSDVMQLAAYCLLIEEETEIAPRYGLLRYAEQTFKVEWNAQLRAELLQILDEMRELYAWPATFAGPMPLPQHDMTVRCDACGFRTICWPAKQL